jgi:arginase family enzyme
VYVALDCDVFEPNGISSFMPEPGGYSVEQAEDLFRAIAGRAPVLGAGLSGLAAEPSNVEPLARLCAALGL